VDALRYVVELVVDRRDNLDAAAMVGCEVFCVE
jgi:hypothetical protein